ncbi:hypothetical protein BDV19DRAFT_394941 [Aspergillus venezuelensis]
MSLQNTDLAAVSTGKELYLYYQQGTEIYEVVSKDGTEWTVSDKPVGDKLKAWGSSITAYYAAHEGGGPFKNKSTAVGTSDWKEEPVPSEIKNQPTEYSKLAWGVCHDNPVGAHQWIFFEQFSDAKLEVSELRRYSDDHWPWVVRKILPQQAATALQGTSLASHLTNETTHLYFQEHSGKVVEYRGSYDEWSSPYDLLKKEDVEINTPLAACGASNEENPHVFYVGSGSPPKVKHYRQNGSAKDVVNYWAGTGLDAALLNGKIYLFYRQSTNPYGIATMEYDGSSWKEGHKVVA